MFKNWKIGFMHGLGMGAVLSHDCDGVLFFVLLVGPLVVEYDATGAFFIDT